MQAAALRRLAHSRILLTSPHDPWHRSHSKPARFRETSSLLRTSVCIHHLRGHAFTANQTSDPAGLPPVHVAPRDSSTSAITAKRDFVPPAEAISDQQLRDLHDFLAHSQRLLVITGAGISTESGIPDYRSPQGAYSQGFKPITHQAFLSSPSTRQRYWARSYIGWRRFHSASPGASHLALARLESRGRVRGGIITQNVDRLHHAAGSLPLELHGTTHRTICLQCGGGGDRSVFQEEMRGRNPEWASAVESLERGMSGSDPSFGLSQRPDGDVEVDDEVWANSPYGFQVPPCTRCGGIMKPDVVFFGDNVPKHRALSAHHLATDCDSLLVVGSSLMVLSAFRLARSVHERGCPITLLNVGPTRADDLATLKIEARCGEVLSRVVAMGSMDVPIGA